MGVALEHPELIRKVHELQEIAVNTVGENALDDSPPANNDGEIHWGLELAVGGVDVKLGLVAHGPAELGNLLPLDLVGGHKLKGLGKGHVAVTLGESLSLIHI